MMEWLTGVLAIAGATLVLLAAIGILRMPDLFFAVQSHQYRRVHHANLARFESRNRACGVCHPRPAMGAHAGG
jgi:hypothetical protein